MNTPSHLIINAALRKWAASGGKLAIPRGAFLLGAVLPDVPLGILWIGGLLYYRYAVGNTDFRAINELLDSFYFNNPFWIASHNLLHSPTLLLIELALLWRFRAAAGSRPHWWFWFFAGCLIHSAIDIPTHVNDGPVLFFPFEWSLRFSSPISYWDADYFGREFTIFELLLDLALLAYLFGPDLWRRLRRRAPQAQQG
jgi:membrane-bound metal-dependent hydrolase YbcI (DUF457 family)